jgi:hypothetical protein
MVVLLLFLAYSLAVALVVACFAKAQDDQKVLLFVAHREKPEACVCFAHHLLAPSANISSRTLTMRPRPFRSVESRQNI